MAGNSTATITFKLDGDVKTFQILAKDAESLKKVLGTSASEAKKLGQELLDMNQAVEAFRGMETLIRGIESAFGSMSAEYNEASANETRLAQSMKTAMGATQEQVDAIIALTDAQEELGVVDGQFQISAAQQLAKFLQTTESLQTLIPLMNGMAAQQYGVAASEQNLMSIATQRPVCKSVATRDGGGLQIHRNTNPPRQDVCLLRQRQQIANPLQQENPPRQEAGGAMKPGSMPLGILPPPSTAAP